MLLSLDGLGGLEGWQVIFSDFIHISVLVLWVAALPTMSCMAITAIQRQVLLVMLPVAFSFGHCSWYTIGSVDSEGTSKEGLV